MYYLKILKLIKKEDWEEIYNYFNSKKKKKFESTIYLSSSDSYTLSNGPTLYLTDDIEKIGIFFNSVVLFLQKNTHNYENKPCS